LNQLPATDQGKNAEVFWVGLSAVAFSQDEDRVPLSPTTRSGALVADIESAFEKSIQFYRTNLVKCLPLKQDKIRYPVTHEMEKCYPNLESEVNELNPQIIFLLGKQVASFVLSKIGVFDFRLDENFKYKVFTINGITYVPVHHPSFVLVYKRNKMNKYINQIRSIVKKKCVRRTSQRQ
jgi:uracil-DNA glycosylase